MGLRISNSIKLKLRVSFLTLIILSAIGALISYRMMSSVSDYQTTKNTINELMIALNNAREAEKDVLLYDRRTVDFLEDGESKNVREHAKNMVEVYATLSQLEEDPLVAELEMLDAIESIQRSAHGYEVAFQKLVRLMVLRGFKDHGLEGEMREYVHNLQDCQSDPEKVFAFQLRRHEKDFFMRQDPKYIERLHETVNEFTAYLQSAPLPHMTPDYLYKVVNGVQAYRNHFDKIVRVERQIGLTDDDGLRGDLKSRAEVVEPQMAYLYKMINERTASLQHSAIVVMVISFAALLIIGIVMSLVLSGTISKPIILLDRVTKNILAGKEDAEVELEGVDAKDEIGSLMTNFRYMLKNLRKNMKLVTEKNEKLELAKEADRKRNWSIEGLALFGEILKRPDDLQKVGREVVGTLVSYLKANQGALFVLPHAQEEDHPQEMDMVACYAWEREKKASQKVGYGDGLVGTAWRDRETLYFTDIPADYVTIRSGLGEAAPSSLLIVPIMTEESVIGVLELASFNPLETYEIEFVEKLAERIANTLSAVQLQDQTKHLLHETQQMAEELQANEEEMRQNMEELQATQEEMARSTHDLLARIAQTEEDLEMQRDIVNKVYDGVVISDDDFAIQYVNQYVTRKLSYSQDDLRGRTISTLFQEDLKALVMDMENDPSYILNQFSDQKEMEITDRLGHAMKVNMVVTKLRVNGGLHYAFLFRKQEYAQAKAYMSQLLEAKKKVNPREIHL